MSPVLFVRGASLGIVSASILIYAILLATSLVFGRAFCAWFCPGAIIQEACTSLGAERIRDNRKYWLKYFVATALYSAAAIGLIHAGGFHRFDWYLGGIGNGPAPIVMRFGAFLILVPLSLIAGRWAFCHHVCWIAPLMIVGTRIRERLRIPGLRLVMDSASCSECATCEESCPMSLPVAQMTATGKMDSNECVLCGNCADACPTGAVQLRFTRS
jgi:polyferredoxin